MDTVLFLLFGLLISNPAQADDTVTFNDVFSKVISQKCMLCHSNPDKKPFDLTTYAEVMTVVIPGDLAASKLYQALLQGQMPPPKIIAADPSFEVTAEEIELIEQWILQGAVE